MTTKQLDAAREARAQLADSQDRGEVARDPRDRLLDLLWCNLDDLPEGEIRALVVGLHEEPAGGITDETGVRWLCEERAARKRQMVEDCQVVKHAIRSIGFRAKVRPLRDRQVAVEFLDE